MRRVLLVAAGCLFLMLAVSVVRACPFCSAPSMTLTEQFTQSDVAILAKWVGGVAAKASDAGSTDFEIVDVMQQKADGSLKKGDKLSLVRYRSSKVGDLFLLLGSQGTAAIEWGSPLEISRAGYDYVKNAPKPDVAPAKRLAYFLKYLEFSDPMVGDDAFGEFANSAYSDVVQLAPQLPREKLRTWLTTETTSPGRLGLYGMMLGLCGTEADAELMEQKIFKSTEEFRLGIDGVMGGYLLLKGSDGLSKLDEKKLKDKKAPFSETYAAMQAIRFMWQYGDNRIPPDRLRESMRMLLDRPELVDLVIADLARMKDWSIQERLMSIYDVEPYNIPSVKRAIVRFTLAAAKDTGAKKDETGTGSTAVAVVEPPAHVILAQKCLEDLEKRDPKTVQEAKRFFVIK